MVSVFMRDFVVRVVSRYNFRVYQAAGYSNAL